MFKYFIFFSCYILSNVLSTPQLAMYWQRDITKIPLESVEPWIDIVIVAFAEVNPDSTLNFPVDDVNIKNGIKQLHSRNQTVLISIGGAYNCGPQGLSQDLMFGNNFNSSVWVESTINLINNYGFYGVDIDYECRDLVLQNPYRVTEALSLLKKQLPNLYISWVAFSTVNKPNDFSNYLTAFLSVNKYLNAVFWASYNIDINPVSANNWYSNANITVFNSLNYSISSVFYGYCINNGCAYGIGPSDNQILSWARDVKLNNGGGLFLWDIQGELNSLNNNVSAFNTIGISRQVSDILHQ